MTSAAATISRLYAGLAACDGDEMAGCYAPGATFEDPAFGQLTGTDVPAMWRMLTSRSTGIRVDLQQHEAAGGTGSAHWVASYQFGPKRRPVVYDVRASFRFDAEGLITEHVDDFNLGRWAAQAMGPVQGLLGHTPLLSLLVRRTTSSQLNSFVRIATSE